MPRRRTLLLLLLVCLSSCVRRPPNEDCGWYDPRSGPLDLNQAADRRHLLQDIETSEDLAVRFMDSHPGDSSSVFNQCFVKLAATISAGHHITPAQFMSEVGQRPAGLDLAVGVSWALLYAWAASAVAAWIRRRQSGGIVMLVYISLVVAALGVLLGDQWTGLWETLRIGNGHLGGRVDRIPWGHHQGVLFAGALVLFWLITALRYRTTRPASEKRQPGLSLT